MGFTDKHLLGIEPLSPAAISEILDLADSYVDLNRRSNKHSDVLASLTQINMFFENSTRTQASFELAGKRLGADVMNMAMQASSIKKGETLIDTALTLNAMHPDLLVVRHPQSGAVDLLAQKVNCSVLNAGDGRHEHPTQALLDALTIRRAKGRLHRLSIAICGDIAHSRVARSNIILLGKMENRIRLIAPPTLMPSGIAEFGCEVYEDMHQGLQDVDVVMMLRLQRERMDGGFIPSEREYYHRYGLDAQKLKAAKDDAIVMHPGPMNRGVEIDGDIAEFGPLDDPVDDFGDPVFVFLVLALAFGFAHFLHDHLLCGLRRNAPEIDRRQRIDDEITGNRAFLHRLCFFRCHLGDFVFDFFGHFKIAGELDIAAFAVDLRADIVLEPIFGPGRFLNSHFHGLQHFLGLNRFFPRNRVCDLQQFQPVVSRDRDIFHINHFRSSVSVKRFLFSVSLCAPAGWRRSIRRSEPAWRAQSRRMVSRRSLRRQ